MDNKEIKLLLQQTAKELENIAEEMSGELSVARNVYKRTVVCAEKTREIANQFIEF